jgi:nicotinate phosphoribosyltransferase
VPEPQRALLVDLYELTMGQSYFDEGIHERPAVFSAYVRHLPPGWDYLVASGLDDVLRVLESFSFSAVDLAYLKSTELFTDAYLDHLAALRFEGEVRAMPEGTVFFPDEPLLELRGRLLPAQLVETIVLNELHFQSLIAAKAARFVDAAAGRTLVDFSLRRTHRGDAGLRVARASYLAGFEATSNVLAGREYGIPIAGTMAHSYVQAFQRELDAFRAYSSAYPDRSILLVDTYDTLHGVRNAATVGRELAARGHQLAGVRLDSGDLLALSRAARSILAEAGLQATTIFASGGLDERAVDALLTEGAPIDGFGIGSALGTSTDAPAMDMAYKLVEVGGRPTMKLSTEKATLPGAKQVWRVSLGGRFAYDVLTTAAGAAPPGGEPLLELVMAGGRRLVSWSLAEARDRCASQRAALGGEHRQVAAEPYEVRISDALLAARDEAVAALAPAASPEG